VASVTSGVPFAKRRAHLDVDIPRCESSRHDHNVLSAERFQDGSDADERPSRTGFRRACWGGRLVLHKHSRNRDGEVLEDPGSFKTKEESKLSVLEYILQPQL